MEKNLQANRKDSAAFRAYLLAQLPSFGDDNDGEESIRQSN